MVKAIEIDEAEVEVVGSKGVVMCRASVRRERCWARGCQCYDSPLYRQLSILGAFDWLYAGSYMP